MVRPSRRKKISGRARVEASTPHVWPRTPLTDRLFLNPPLTPATAKDRADWKGFCEIESEPACFNVMLKDFGVNDVKVHEVLGLDAAMIDSLP